MVDLTAPPRDPVFAGCVGEPQQEIAMACERCAEVFARGRYASVIHGLCVWPSYSSLDFAAPALVDAASARRPEFDGSGNIELVCERQLFQPRGVCETDDFEIIGSVAEFAVPHFSERRPDPIRPNNDIVGMVWRRLCGDLAHDPVFPKLVGTIPDDAT